MKIVAVCDAEGNISSITAHPIGSAPAAFPLVDGQRAVQLSVLGLAENLDDTTFHTKLANIRANCRVDRRTGNLVHRSACAVR